MLGASVDDPTFGGDCCIPYDHVVNDCVSRHEKLLSNYNQCFTKWKVYWYERFVFIPPGGVGIGTGSL